MKQKNYIICCVCDKKKEVIKSKIKKQKTCSKICARILTGKKLKGKKRPDVSLRLMKNNPMKNKKIANKVSKTMKRKYASGELDHLLDKTRRINLNPNHPSNNKKVADKIRKTLIRKFENGELHSPMIMQKISRKVGKTLRKKYASGELSPCGIGSSQYYNGIFLDKGKNKHKYDSGWELKRMMFLDKQPKIKWKKLTSEYRIPYIENRKCRTYFPDFEVKYKNKVVVEEVGMHQKSKKNKIKAAILFFKNRKEKFVTLGRKQLNEKTW